MEDSKLYTILESNGHSFLCEDGFNNGTNPTDNSDSEKPRSEFVQSDNLERKVPKCRCLVSRSVSRNEVETNSVFFQRSFKQNQKIIPLSKYLCDTRLPKHKSMKFYFCAFLLWSLLVAPILNDALQQALPVKRRHFFGGVSFSEGCQPGRVMNGGTRPRSILNLTPFQRNEYVPKLSEQTIGASGPKEGPIYRDSKRYREDLIANYNTDIEFLNEEQTNEDRMMTRMCNERLNELAMLVITYWQNPKVKLRVTEAWDDLSETDFIIPERALHYEGRAVDITTSDQDHSKYPILARLAVEAGFDWVIYKTSYVHCSVRSGSIGDSRNRGCFPGESRVQIPGGGSIRMDELRPGGLVYSVDSNGKVVTDTILAFMDSRSDVIVGEQAARRFTSISTESGHTLRLTRNHLVHTTSSDYVKNSTAHSFWSIQTSKPIFAGKVKVGSYIYVTNLLTNATLRSTKVIEVDLVEASSGAYAPLTNEGTIIVDGAVASCYAVLENEYFAHLAMTPVRLYHKLRLWAFSSVGQKPNNESYYFDTNKPMEGVMLYADFLFELANKLIPEPWFWGD